MFFRSCVAESRLVRFSAEQPSDAVPRKTDGPESVSTGDSGYEGMMTRVAQANREVGKANQELERLKGMVDPTRLSTVDSKVPADSRPSDVAVPSSVPPSPQPGSDMPQTPDAPTTGPRVAPSVWSSEEAAILQQAKPDGKPSLADRVRTLSDLRKESREQADKMLGPLLQAGLEMIRASKLTVDPPLGDVQSIMNTVLEQAYLRNRPPSVALQDPLPDETPDAYMKRMALGSRPQTFRGITEFVIGGDRLKSVTMRFVDDGWEVRTPRLGENNRVMGGEWSKDAELFAARRTNGVFMENGKTQEASLPPQMVTLVRDVLSVNKRRIA